MNIENQIKDIILQNDWKQAQSELDILSSLGEGRRVAAVIESAGRRHGTNLGITVHKYSDFQVKEEILDVILFSKCGAFSSRKYEIHIPFRLGDEVSLHAVDGRSMGMLVTTSNNEYDHGAYTYQAPLCASVNALKWALVHIGQATAAEQGLVESYEVDDYLEVADPKEKSIEEWVEFGWWAIGSAIERAMNSYLLAGRNLVLPYAFEENDKDYPICPFCRHRQYGIRQFHPCACVDINFQPDAGIASNPYADSEEGNGGGGYHDGRGYPLPDRQWVEPEVEDEEGEVNEDELPEWQKDILGIE